MLEKQAVKFPKDIENLISQLKRGNERFVSNQLKSKDFQEIRSRHVKGQSPKTIVLSCADSRVSPEYIFDAEPGELFIIRMAGNILSSNSIGNIEFAVHSLGSKLLLILGHEDCGAVKAAQIGVNGSQHLQDIINHIIPEVSVKTEDEVCYTKSAIANVENQIEKAHNEPLIKNMIDKGELHVIGGIYMLESGKVRLFI